MASVDVLQLLHVAYSGTKEQRTAATAQLEAALKSAEGPQHLLALFHAGLNNSLPPEQSLSALIYAKNCLVHTLSEEELAAAPGLVEEIERVILSGVFAVPQSHRRVARQCIATLVSMYNWNFLDQLLPAVVASDPSQVPAELSLARMEILYTFTKRFKTPGLEPMPMKLAAASELVGVLSSYFAYEDFRVSHYTFKVMECVLETALQLSSSKDIPGDAFDSWLDIMAAFAQRYADPARQVGGKAYEEFVLCMKRIAIITYSILNDATRRKKPAPLAAHFLAKYGVGFLAVWRQWLESCLASTDRAVHRKSEMFAIRYVKLATLDETMFTQYLRPHAVEVVEKLFFPYLCYNEDDEEVFADDENLGEYVQYMVEEGVGMGELSPRQAAANAILALIGGKKSFHTPQTLLQELLTVLTNGLGLPTDTENFPRLFGFMHLLSILRKYLRGVPEIWDSQMALVLMRYVAPRMAPSNPFPPLRCKALVVCQRYSKVPMPSSADMQAFVEMICGVLYDKDPRMRLGAIDAMCTLLELKQARGFMRSYLVPLVEECLSFLNKVQTTFIPTAILHLTTYFAPELTPVMGKLGHTLCQHFLATTFDLESMEDGTAELDDMALARLENAAFSGDALLDAIYTIVTACGENNQALDAIRPDVMRLVRRVLEQPDSFDFIEKTLGILLHVVAFSKPIPQDCWDVLPLLFQSVDSGIGVDFFSMIEEVLDNFVSGAPEAFMGNEELMTALFNLCEKMLIGNVVCAPECRAAPAQLIEAMLHVAKHAAQPGMFDRYLSRFVTLLLQALIHHDIVTAPASVRVWVTAALMDCFYYNADATLTVIVQCGAFPSFFQGFFYLYRSALQKPEEAAPAVPKPKKKKSKASQKADDPEAAVSSLSILTRKVITLGLSSLLTCTTRAAADTNSPLHATSLTLLAEFIEPILSFVQYCIFVNEGLYETRCQLSEKSIADIRAGVEEAVEDVDPNDDVVLGVDGGDDTVLDGDDVEDWDEDDYTRGGDSLFGGAPDEGDDYQSPIDDVNEVGQFLEWATALSQQPAELQQRAGRVLRSFDDYTRAATVAQRYRALCIELEAAMQTDFANRSAQPTA